MNLDELQSVQSKERRNDTLQHLRDSFYDDVGEYVADLKNRRDLAAERADDPFGSEEVRRLTDEIETAEEVVEKVYERRMGKLVKQASLAAAGMTADTEGMTVEERDLFDEIVDSIERNKGNVLATLSGESADPDPEPDPESDPTAAETGHGATAGDVSAASMMADDGPSDRSPAPEGSTPATPDPSPTDAARPSEGQPSAVGDDTPPSSGGPAGTSDDAPTEPAGDPLSDPDDGADRPPTEAQAVVSDEELTDGGAARGAALGATNDAGDGPLASDDGPSASDDEPTIGDAGGTVEADRSTVRITDDVGPIFGVDGREYDLERSDVVQLPEQNAEPLLEQDAAERLD